MDLTSIGSIIPELRAAIAGRRFGKVFPLSRYSMAIDFRLADSLYLFISVESADPRIYLIRRRIRDLEKASTNPSAFVMQIKKRLAGSDVVAIEQFPNERVVKIELRGKDEFGEDYRAGLIAQLTGKSANLFLVNGEGRIVDALRETLGDGQQVGDIYAPPSRPANTQTRLSGLETVTSESLDAADLEKRADAAFRSAANSARSKITREIAKLEKLRSKLLGDLESHGDAERWKRFGDLLLANVATAKRNGSIVTVVDYFDESVPSIDIEVDENDQLTVAAEKFFKRYTKARNARDEIAKRIETIRQDLGKAQAELESIDKAIEGRDIDAFRENVTHEKQPGSKHTREKSSSTSAIARTFISSDGFEILVGKRAKDNDQLTFKVAKSLDTWMHAADYPGSHVVIRNRDKKEIPPTTLLEAAQLAAFYSQGKAQPKAAVHYTLKKFVNKPKGSAPGLVSLASFKTLLVEPVVPDGVIRQQP
ncbi:MAG TPA: NFACT family protein [Pyrinomonadaceae bacterium]|nr:NFACT family protein [Pyrinomonadaceae bacterium]